MKKTFIAIGMLLSISTDQKFQIVPTVKVEASSYEELMAEITTKFNNSKEYNQRNLNPLGAVFSICEHTEIDVDGKEFVNDSYKLDTIGELDNEQFLQLQDLVLETV